MFWSITLQSVKFSFKEIQGYLQEFYIPALKLKNTDILFIGSAEL